MRVVIIEGIAYHLRNEEYIQLIELEKLADMRSITSREFTLWLTKSKMTYINLGKVDKTFY